MFRDVGEQVRYVVEVSYRIYQSSVEEQMVLIPRLLQFGLLSFYTLPILVAILKESPPPELREVVLDTMEEIRDIFVSDYESFISDLEKMRPVSHSGIFN